MHRHRSLVLVPAFIFAAACSKGDDSASTSSPLDRDLTLSAQLQGTAKPNGAVELAAGGACAVQPTPKAPSATQRAQALSLEQKAAEAEFVGNIAAARDLHRQAARLDATSEAIAYRLARADEASGDRSAAVADYCRYLTLAPSATNAQEVRTRLNALLANGAATRVARSAPAARQTYAVAAPVQRAEGRRVATTQSVTVAPSPAAAPAASAEPDVVAGSSESATVASSTGEVVTASAEPEMQTQREPTPRAPQASRPADHTLRNAAIGAAAGAAIGGMTGRSTKGAVIGGLAGGVLGAIAGKMTGGSGFRTPGFSH